jgi:integrase
MAVRQCEGVTQAGRPCDRRAVPGSKCCARHGGRVKLNLQFLRKLKPDGQDRIFYDEKLTGFAARMKPSGKVSFLVEYRRESGEIRRFTFGSWPPMPPDGARKKAGDLLNRVSHGEDPSGDRQQDRAASTVKEAAVLYLEHCDKVLKPRSAAEYRRHVERSLLPALGKAKLKAVQRGDVLTLFHRLQKKAPIGATRALATFSGFFKWAESANPPLRAPGSNPCTGIKRPTERPRTRVLSPDELGRLGEALREAEAAGREWPPAVAWVRLALLTGARKGELLTARREWLDEAAGVLRLPDSKTGARSIYLGRAALDVVASLPRLVDNPHLLAGMPRGGPSRDELAAGAGPLVSVDGHLHVAGCAQAAGDACTCRIGPLVNVASCWARLCREAGIDGARPHDLRRTFASVAGGELGYAPVIVAALLGHGSWAGIVAGNFQTTSIYVVAQRDPLREAAEAVSRRLVACLGEAPEAEILEFPGAGALTRRAGAE